MSQVDLPDVKYLTERIDGLGTRIRCGMCGTMIKVDYKNYKVQKGRNLMDIVCPTCKWNKEMLNLRYFGSHNVRLPPSRSIIYNPLKF